MGGLNTPLGLDEFSQGWGVSWGDSSSHCWIFLQAAAVPATSEPLPALAAVRGPGPRLSQAPPPGSLVLAPFHWLSLSGSVSISPAAWLPEGGGSVSMGSMSPAPVGTEDVWNE